MTPLIEKSQHAGDIVCTSRLMLGQAIELRQGCTILREYEYANRANQNAPFSGNSWHILALLSLEIFLKMLACYHRKNTRKNHHLNKIYEELPDHIRNAIIIKINEIRAKNKLHPAIEHSELSKYLALYGSNIIKARYFFDEYLGKSGDEICTKFRSHAYNTKEILHDPGIEYQSEFLQNLLEALEHQCISDFIVNI